ncbi:hypothetical protein [Pengzhenrongella phosphoraccumulans]|uniref:hypothetical protein n=1 Tax=Pengzhenrongella phosphoraccumulans TaxID=3114394 RepID=UPI003890FFA0
MTRWRDERQTARDARAAGLARAAAVGAELATLPGWLLVGDPDRLADTGLRAQAHRGTDLRAELAEIHRGVAALDAELDALDGERTQEIFLFLEWCRWLEGLTDAQDVLDQLVPDPRRLFLGAQPRLTLATAQRMLDVIAANGGRVGDGQTFVEAAALADDDVFDLDQTGRVRLDPLAADHLVGVLLPMRLETRYRRPEAAGDPWRLRVRVHPDPVALARPPLPASRQEAERVADCWTYAAGDLTSDAGAAAFTSLAGAVGGARAAYLLRSVPVVATDAGFAPAAAADDDQGGRAAPYRAALPDVLTLWGDAGAGLRRLGEVHPDLVEIAAQADLGTALADLRPDELPELWWTSYAAAVRVGLAVEVELPDGPHLDVLLVTGLAELDARTVFEAHAELGSLGLVAPMTPTNTVAGQPTADVGRDPARWLAIARAAGSGTAGGLAGVLTTDPLLDGVGDVDTALLDVVPHLVTALWPVLWQRWLKDVENAAEIYQMGDWAARVLAPLGTWPALRVGDVPYGVLPAVDLAAWRPALHDAVWEEGVTVLLGQVAPDWSTAAARGGTAVGADADALLDVIGRVPTSREVGSRALLPLEVVAVLDAIINGVPAPDTLAAWEAMAAAALAVEPAPARRYQGFGYAQPAVRGGENLRELLETYLRTSWEELAFNGREEEDRPPLLARLLRHSLLLTQAEVSRLGESWASWTHQYLPPLDDARRLADDAAQGRRVSDLPQYALDRLAEQFPPDPNAAAIARQFLDVRDAVRELAARDAALLDGGPLAPAVAAVIDTSSHRIDPWVTAVGTRRLRRLIARDVPRRIGAYGWVDDLDPAVDPTPPTSAGLLHAPGNAQALTAAVLRDHVHDDDPRWQLTIRSDLARLAARLGGDVRLGIHLSEALGREIERRAGDPGAVLDLRRRFPARPEWAGRRVCDGQQVLDAVPATLPASVGDLTDLRQVLDTYGDLLVADAVHDVVSGRAAAAAESMEAAAGLGAPPELRVLRTQRQGFSVRTTVLVALPIGAADPASPVTVADPALSALLVAETGPASAWTWTRAAPDVGLPDGGPAAVSLVDLGLDVPDVVLLPQARLDALAATALGGPADGGTAGGRRVALDRLCSLLDLQRGLPDVVGDPAAGETELRDRLATLRLAAADVLAGLTADPPIAAPARRWGLVDDDAAVVLAARLAAAGSADSDATADAATLGERLRALLAPTSGLPLVCTGTLPAVLPGPDLDRDWLEVVAAVRPAVARLEAHQLLAPWAAAATDPARLWTVPGPSQRDVVVYGPAAALAGAAAPVGIALLDDWAETVPSPKHTTHAAFGFDAPRARAPQAVLLALPPDERTPLTADALPSLVLSTRDLARARMAQPDQLGAWALAVPTSMVLASGPAGTDLRERS